MSVRTIVVYQASEEGSTTPFKVDSVRLQVIKDKFDAAPADAHVGGESDSIVYIVVRTYGSVPRKTVRRMAWSIGPSCSFLRTFLTAFLVNT